MDKFCCVASVIIGLQRVTKVNQINSVIQSGAGLGMTTMDASLLKLYQEKKITKTTALKYRIHYGYEYMTKRLGGVN